MKIVKTINLKKIKILKNLYCRYLSLFCFYFVTAVKKTSVNLKSFIEIELESLFLFTKKGSHIIAAARGETKEQRCRLP